MTMQLIITPVIILFLFVYVFGVALGSGFVPTDSMPTALRWFAEYQPFTPIMETLRGLLLDTPIGDSAGIAAVSYLWAKNTFDKG